MHEGSPERWLPVIGWEGFYEVSDLGRVKSLSRVVQRPRYSLLEPERITFGGRHNGYRRVLLSNKPRQEQLLVHVLVMQAFVGPRPDGMDICHNNGIRSDNRLANLRYDTSKANAADRKLHGTEYKLAHSSCVRGHPFEGSNLMLRPTESGVKRICLRCHRVTTREGLRRMKGYYERRGLTPPTLDEAVAELDTLTPLATTAHPS